jgi:hypothetical protein
MSSEIEESDQQRLNTESSMQESVELGTNVTLESCVHSEKQAREMVSTVAGTQMDKSD